MQKEKPITGGRKGFHDLVNKSNAADLHPFDEDAAIQAERNRAKNVIDFSDPTGRVYVPPKLK